MDGGRAGAPPTLPGRDRELGLSNRVIAEQLALSVKTVETHPIHVYSKIYVDGRAAAAALAVGHGLLE